MLCEKCKSKLATVYITKVVNGKKTEQRICIDCAKSEHAFPAELGGIVSVDSLLKGFFGDSQLSVPDSPDAHMMCPVCGMTMSKLSENGRFGCGECYKLFGDNALRLIRHIHGRKRHIGKFPKRGGGVLGLKRRLTDYRAKLEAHVSQEEYEEAAKLRDEIREIERNMRDLTEGKNDAK